MTKLSIQFSLLTTQEQYGGKVPDTYDLFGHWDYLIDANVKFFYNGEPFFEDVYFPIAKFTADLNQWFKKEYLRGERFNWNQHHNGWLAEIHLEKSDDIWTFRLSFEDKPDIVKSLTISEFETSLTQYLRNAHTEILNFWAIDIFLQ